MYRHEDLITKKRHIYTKDMRFYLASDGPYDYWREVIRVLGDKVTLGCELGHHSYDYCFRSDLHSCINKLNKLITKEL